MEVIQTGGHTSILRVWDKIYDEAETNHIPCFCILLIHEQEVLLVNTWMSRVQVDWRAVYPTTRSIIIVLQGTHFEQPRGLIGYVE